MNTVKLTSFSKPDYVSQALEGTWGIDGYPNVYFTLVKGLCFVNAAGPCSFDGVLPENAFAWHLKIFDDSGLNRVVPVRDSRLSFSLEEGETAEGSFRVKA
jgi:hypothetical protein